MSWYTGFIGPKPVPTEDIVDCAKQRDFIRVLSNADLARLVNLARIFLKKKVFEGAAGLVVNDRMRIDIAVQACLPILNLDPTSYDDWHSVILYPGDFIVDRELIDNTGVVHQYKEVLAGESWERGPVVLSWDANLSGNSGTNVVIHEFAHKLDLQDGYANGCPPLHPGMSPHEWNRVFTAGYAAFCNEVDAGVVSEIDPFASENPAEFFAVLSELFFVNPHLLIRRFPFVFRQFQLYYRQNPLHEEEHKESTF